jgi:chorismate dehydratase
MRVGRIPYINCYPVYGAIERGIVPLDARWVDGTPTALNRRMARGTLDVSVVSAVEYARTPERYVLLPDLAISCDGPVRSVMLFSHRSASELDGARVLVSRSSMTSVALLQLLFEGRWNCRPQFIPADAELSDVHRFSSEPHDARLVIGDAALMLSAGANGNRAGSDHAPMYEHAYDLGDEWKRWTELPFVFAVWVAKRTAPVEEALRVHSALTASRDWGVRHVPELAVAASGRTGIAVDVCEQYLSGLDYELSYAHLAGLTEFFRRLVSRGRVPNGTLVFLPAA